MCGIVGFAGFDRPQLLARMSQRVAHRGPDSSGEYHSRDSQQVGTEEPRQLVSLAARRLSIMDPVGGTQPLNGTNAAVVFNGEIYNDAELRRELTASGAHFTTGSDTEVLLRGFERWGWEQLIPRLNGMFAIALHDRSSGKLLLARDRTGQKPLYYSHQAGALLFASEMKALLESDTVDRTLNEPVIDQFLTLRYVPQPQTLLKGVHILPAGHTLKWCEGRIEVKRYWQPPIRDLSTDTGEQLLEEWTTLFDGAVHRTLRSDVPVGAYLSGGVDSSLLVSTIAGSSDVGPSFSGRTYSAGFAGGGAIDETRHAVQLANQLDIENRIVELSEASLAQLPRVLWQLERPIGEPLILAYDALASTAAQDVKAVVSGEGADELFAGYSFHRVIERMRRMSSGWKSSPKAIAVALRCFPVSVLNRWFSFPAYLGATGKQRVVSFASQFGQRHLGQNYAALRSLFDVDQRSRLYSNTFRHEASESWIDGGDDRPARPLERLLNLQYHDWLQDFALLRQDKLSMAHGLEVRLPFLDNTVIDFAAKLPASCKLGRRSDKVLLRSLAKRRLPTEYAARTKQPFYFPLETVFKSAPFRQLMQRTLDPAIVKSRNIFDVAEVERLERRASSGEFLPLKQLTSLIILELWMQMFVDGQDP